MTKRQFIILGVFILLIILIIVVISMDKGDGKFEKEEEKNDKTYVRVQKIVNDTVDVIVNGYGRVTSSRNIILSSEVQGVILNSGFPLKTGQNFSQGQLLLKINDKEAQLALKARKSSFLNLVATVLPDIKIDFPSNASNWQAFLDKIDLDEPLADLPEFSSNKEKTFLAAKNILTEYYTIKGDEEKVKKYNMYAPFNGSVVEVVSEIGTSVNPGSPIATIMKTVGLEVAVPIDPNNASLIDIGNNVVLYSDDKKTNWKGTVNRIANTVTENTQSIAVFITIPENDNLYNGMYIEAKITAHKIYDAVEIPRRALLDDGMVYTVKDSMLIKASIQILKRNKKSIIIRGFKDNEMVVIEPVSGAIDSMKVAPLFD